MATIADLFRRIQQEPEALDDAAQVAAERQLARIRAMPVGELVALTKGAIHETMECLLFELAEEWAEAERLCGFDDLAAGRAENRDE